MSGGQVQKGNTVGWRMRLVRKQAGSTLKDVGDLLGVTRQQIAKYEDGISRISAEQLMLVARRFGVPLSHFYDHDASSGTLPSSRSEGQAARMNQAFAKVEDHRIREYLITLTEEAANGITSLQPELRRIKDG